MLQKQSPIYLGEITCYWICLRTYTTRGFFPKMVWRLHSIWYTKYIPTYLTAFFFCNTTSTPETGASWMTTLFFAFEVTFWWQPTNQPTMRVFQQTFFPPVDEPHFRYCWKSIEFIMRERGCNSVICFTYNACRHSWYIILPISYAVISRKNCHQL